jgi:hypothetical protein
MLLPVFCWCLGLPTRRIELLCLIFSVRRSFSDTAARASICTAQFRFCSICCVRSAPARSGPDPRTSTELPGTLFSLLLSPSTRDISLSCTGPRVINLTTTQAPARVQAPASSQFVHAEFTLCVFCRFFKKL